MPLDNFGPFSLTPELEQLLFPLLERHEGRIKFIYPDSDGNPTVGVGHLLSEPEAAMKLPFVRTSDELKADPAQIESAWTFVRNTKKMFRGLFLRDNIIDDTLREDVIDAQWKLHKTFGSLNPIPRPAVVALYDMMFNIGSLKMFPKMKIGVLTSDFFLAAAESKRTGISDTRNDAVRKLFLDAAAQSIQQQHNPVKALA